MVRKETSTMLVYKTCWVLRHFQAVNTLAFQACRLAVDKNSNVFATQLFRKFRNW